MISYPIQFSYNASAAAGVESSWQTKAPEDREALCAIPPEFGGPGRGYSPEDFFGLAVLNCFVATFKVIAEKSRISFEALDVSGELVVDRDEKGRPWMKAFTIKAKVLSGGGGSSDRVQRVLEKTAESCIVVNSIKSEVLFSFEVN